MTKPDTGGPAYPFPAPAEAGIPGISYDDVQGMTLLDSFAGQAMQGLINSGDYKNVMDHYTPNCPEPTKRDCSQSEIAAWAYEIAEAMIAEKRRRKSEC